VEPPPLVLSLHTRSVAYYSPQRRFGLGELEDADLPQFRLFLAGVDPRIPLNYTGKVEREEMSAWLVAHTSLFLGKRVSARSVVVVLCVLCVLCSGKGGWLC